MEKTDKTKRVAVYLIPALLLITTYLAFHFLSWQFDPKTGYFLGFVFYWSFWCVSIPLLLLGGNSVKTFFKLQRPLFGKYKIRNILFLLLPLVFAYSYEFPKALAQSNLLIIISSLALSFINAVLEEILWRGTFLKLMGVNSGLYIPLSSLGFAVWHFVPLSIFGNSNPGGSFSFVFVSFILGCLYSTVFKDTKSILLIAASHILFDFSGLGARIYF